MLEAFGGERYIVNLGHGIYPDAPVDAVKTFVEAVHNFKIWILMFFPFILIYSQILYSSIFNIVECLLVLLWSCLSAYGPLLFTFDRFFSLVSLVFLKFEKRVLKIFQWFAGLVEANEFCIHISFLNFLSRLFLMMLHYEPH